MTIYIIPTLFFVFFLYQLYKLLSETGKVNSEDLWVKVEARILDRRIDKKESRIFKKITVSNIHFFADFNLDNVRYGVTEVSIIKASKSLLRKTLRELGSKKVCDVYYNKKKPHESYLIDPRTHNFLTNYFIAFVFLCLTLFSYFLIL